MSSFEDFFSDPELQELIDEKQLAPFDEQRLAQFLNLKFLEDIKNNPNNCIKLFPCLQQQLQSNYSTDDTETPRQSLFSINEDPRDNISICSDIMAQAGENIP